MELVDEILSCEEALLYGDEEVSAEQLLAGDFTEIGVDGQRHDRNDVLLWLERKSPDIRWRFRDFTVRDLGAGLVLASYHAQRIESGETSKGAMHSSVWRKHAHRHTWQMVFHQTTKIS